MSRRRPRLDREQRDSVLPPAFIPPFGAVDNKRFINRLRDWGCTIARSSSAEEVSVLFPDGENLYLHSEHSLYPNPPALINECLDSLGVEWDRFWRANLHMSREEIAGVAQGIRILEIDLDDIVHVARAPLSREIARQEREEVERQQRRERWARKAAERLARMRGESEMDAVSQEPEEPTQDPVEPEQDSTPTPQRPRSRDESIINRVWQVLVDSGEALTCHRLSEVTGLRVTQVSPACANLVRYGIVERVKTGVYRAKHEHAHHDVRVGGLVMANNQITALEVPAPTPISQERALAVVQAVAEPREPSPESDQDIVTEVLELLLPGGQVPVRAINAVVAWQEATLRLLRECRDEYRLAPQEDDAKG